MIEEKRFTIMSSYLDMYTVFDEEKRMPLSSHEVERLLNVQHDKIYKLMDNLDYYKSKSASLETGLIQQERMNHKYCLKVKDTLQRAYDLSDESYVFGEDVGGGKYIGQHQRIAILRLLKNIAKELGVDLE